MTEAGMALHFAQISDIHVRPHGELARRTMPTAQLLERTAAFINRMQPRPAFVLLTGDVLDDGGEPQAKVAARILDGLEMPLFVVPGNHDDRQALAAAFGPRRCPRLPSGHIQHATMHEGLVLIGLDTSEPGRPGGVLCDTRLAWLADVLAAHAGRPAVLYMHHPPVRFGVRETDEDGFEGRERLAALLAEHGNVLAVLCGHIHLFAHGRLGCVPVTTAPPVCGMRLVLDLQMREPSAFHPDDPAFLLHRWVPGEDLVSHLVPVKETEKRYF